jgi:small subunit ribosomal protein S4
MSYRGPKVRISRKLGVTITPKAGKIMQNKPYPPGMHGVKKHLSRGRVSVYKAQLLEKQKLRFQYNISEKQLRNYYKKADKKVGNTSDLLIQALETRLDALVFRGGLARTIYAARQYVSHGHMMVDGKIINKPGYPVRVNEEISVKEKSKKLPCFGEAVASANPPPPYITANKEEMKITLGYVPMRDEVPVVCEIPSVIEYYSK